MIRRWSLWVAMAAWSVFVLACFSFRIPAPHLPGNCIESAELCKKVEASDDLLTPVDTLTVFAPTDDVVSFIRLRNVPGMIQLRWKWYAPDRTLVRDTGNVSVNADEKYLDIVTASDPLRPSCPEKREGDWTVCIFINDALACVQQFVTKK